MRRSVPPPFVAWQRSWSKLFACGMLVSAIWAPASAQSCLNEAEPNNNPAVATPADAAGCITGTLTGDDQDLFLWTIADEDAAQHWTFAIEGIAGQTTRAEIFETRIEDGGIAPRSSALFTLATEDGRPVESGQLLLLPGAYLIGISKSGGEGAYTLSINPEADLPAAIDAEPNDRADQATPIAGPVALTGDLQDSADFMRWTIADAGQFWRLSAQGALGSDFSLRLLGEDGSLLAQRSADRFGRVELASLGLPAGDYLIDLGPENDRRAHYVLELSLEAERDDEAEIEPNDRVETAFALADPFTVTGRLVGNESDVFAFDVAGDPMLWRVQVLARDVPVKVLRWYDGAGDNRQQINNPPDRRVRLDNLLLLPGRHYVEVAGEDTGYLLRIVPIGPADPEAVAAFAVDEDPETAVPGPRPAGQSEFEPNDAMDRAGVLRFGEPRVGLLTEATDIDIYRFHLAAEQLVRVTVAPPADGQLVFDVTGGLRTITPEVGVPVSYEALLLSGDHFISLRADSPFEGYYQVLVEQVDPFAVPVDLEPNDREEDARVLALGEVAAGRIGEHRDFRDWYRLPTFATDTEVAIEFSGNVALGFHSGGAAADALFQEGADGVRRGTVPAGTVVTIELSGTGTYRLAVTTGSLQPPLLAADAFSITLSTATPQPAAYRREGQTVDFTLRLENRGPQVLEIAFEGRTNDVAWTLLLPPPTTVAAGQSLELPVVLTVPPDAGDDQPVLVSVAARATDGSIVTALSSLSPACEAAPLLPVWTWPLPQELLGGVNVAWSGLGAVMLSSPAAAAELFDDLVMPLQDRPPFAAGEAVTIDLVGDEPVTLVGALIHPLGPITGRGDAAGQMRDFVILTSLDGDTFTEVFAGRLDSVRSEQAFVFETPVDARFARLLIVDGYGGDTDVTLGEVKLIADPATDPIGEPINLAAPEVGGNVVWSDPLIEFVGPEGTLVRSGHSMLTAVEERPTVDLEAGQVATWVVGFRNGRAAAISGLAWRDGNAAEAERFVRVEVSVSMSGPLGPWELLSWLPDGAAENPVEFDSPVWARFVRFEAIAGGAGTYALPETLRIIERPTEEAYHSVLGEWGFDSPRAIFEFLEEADEAITAEADDDPAGAQPRPLGTGWTVGAVEAGRDLDRYWIDVPDGHDSLRIFLEGSPSSAVAYRLEDAAGNEVAAIEFGSSTQRIIEAAVGPGRYVLTIEEPPRSVVFAWDTSASVGPYSAFIENALIEFVSDVSEFEVVNLLPFDDPSHFLLSDFSGDPLALLAALNSWDRSSVFSSNVEEALLVATQALGGRVGAHAIVVLSDGYSSGYDRSRELWQALADIPVQIFSLHTPSVEHSSDATFRSRALMQSWTVANGGYYDAADTIGAFDDGFARLSCWLRRAKDYRIRVETGVGEAVVEPAVEPAEPVAEGENVGAIRVIAGEAPDGEGAFLFGGNTAVEVILDASGSMFQQLEGRFRYEIARDVLTDLVSSVLPPEIPFALRVFGNREGRSCRTDLEVPLAPLDPGAVRNVIAAIEPQPFAGTPLAASLRLVAQDLATADGTKLVILVTDGEESCDGNVEAEIRALREQGLNVVLNIIGFDVDAEDPVAARNQFQAWAELGGGRYFHAASAAELATSLRAALRPGFELIDAAGVTVAVGVVDGPAVAVPAGVYTVRVLTNPVRVLGDIRVATDATVELPLSAAP